MQGKSIPSKYGNQSRQQGAFMKVDQAAASNFEHHLKQNPYPGRGLVLGSSAEDTWVIIYWIMGRSTNSRNRRFVSEGAVLRTEPVDLSLVADPSLIIYEAMLELPGIYLVSNGDQTRTIYETLKSGDSIDDALATREREPDAPNFTPRISGMLQAAGASASIQPTLSILKANPIDPAFTDRYTYRPAPPQAGYGFGLTTYSGDGDPLPSFAGDPLLLPCNGKAEAILEHYWNALNAENRVSLAVKEISAREQHSRLLIKNRF
jgi:IMP cyclohydrolase